MNTQIADTQDDRAHLGVYISKTQITRLHLLSMKKSIEAGRRISTSELIRNEIDRLLEESETQAVE